MVRLTYPILSDSENEKYESQYWRETLLYRLVAYENTGLMPNEIKVLQELHDFYNSQDCLSSKRLVELAESERDGRLVVLPCKVGDKLYFINKEQYGNPKIIESTEWIAVTTADGLYFEEEHASYEDDYDYILGDKVFLTKEEAEQALKGTNE